MDMGTPMKLCVSLVLPIALFSVSCLFLFHPAQREVGQTVNNTLRGFSITILQPSHWPAGVCDLEKS